MIGITAVVCLLMVILLYQGSRMSDRLEANETKIEELDSQIEDETQRTEDISEMQEYMQSDEYLQQQAKDKLGLITDGEIIFKESSD